MSELNRDIQLEWNRLVEEIMNCKKCPLHKYRKNPVPGEGSITSPLMFVGEAPGSKEDETGRPFVGAAGKFLTELIEVIGLKRSDVFITNIVKCRPPGNRDPLPEEVNACLPYLIRQIKLIKPKVIVALGRHAARTLYSLAGLKWSSMSRMHGRIRDIEIEGIRIKIVTTYHPAAALYNPRLKDTLIKDFKESVTKAIEEVLKKQTIESNKSRSIQRSILDYL